MSIKVTRKGLKENYVVVHCAYGDSQYLILPNTPILYNYGVCGWNWNAYLIKYNNGKNIFALVDGYRSHPSSDYKNHKDYEIVKKYNEKARKVCEEVNDYKTRYDTIQHLIDEMMEELKPFSKLLK